MQMKTGLTRLTGLGIAGFNPDNSVNPVSKKSGSWLPDMDLNHDKQIQSLLCYRYTIGQIDVCVKLKSFIGQSSRRWLMGLVFALLNWLFVLSGHAQFYRPVIIDSSMLKFLDVSNSFSATMETEMDGKLAVQVAIRDGMSRVDMDITKVEQKESDSVMKEYFADLKKVGTVESASIFNPNQKSMFTILPKLKVYLQQPIPDDALEQLKRRPKPERVELGKEKVDGHPCTKYKLSFDKEVMDVWRTWETPSAIVWSADDLNGCPLRIQVINSTGETNGTCVFKDIKTNKPASSLFEPPKDFKKFDNSQEFLGYLSEKMPKGK